jgi:hypothetical protein
MPMASESPRIVCVLGMHRSGTSVTAGILHHLGMFLGREHRMMEPAEDNPRGFWEYEPFRLLNDEILAALGGTWDRPPSFPSRWERSRAVRELARRGKRLASEEFGEHERWAWKDPRTSLTLPLWERVLSPMRYALCVRNPLDVARSLEGRDGIPIADGIALWLTYVRAAVRNTADRPRLVVAFDDLIRAPLGEAARIAAFAGVAIDEAGERRVEGFVASELRHHETPPGEILEAGEIPPEARALYALLRLRARADGDEGRALDEALAALATA